MKKKTATKPKRLRDLTREEYGELYALGVREIELLSHFENFRQESEESMDAHSILLFWVIQMLAEERHFRKKLSDKLEGKTQ